MKKLAALLLSGVMVTGLLAGCGSNSTPTTQESEAQESASETDAKEQETEPEAEPAEEAETEAEAEPEVERVSLNIAYMPNYAALWAVLTGIDQGYFDEEGLDLTLYEFADGPTEIAAMESGSIDLAYIGNGAHKLCVTGDASIFLPQQVNTTDSVVVNEASGIKTLEDLKGKKVAYASGTSSETSLKSALDKAGLSFDDIEAYETEASNMVASMASGSVDACATWSPYTLEILNEVEGTKKLEFENGTVSLASWVALPSYVEKNRDILVRFSCALLKAMDYGSQKSNYEYVAQLVADQTATDYEINFYQTEDSLWFNQELLRSYLEDGTLKGYFETQQQNFIDTEVLTADDATDVENYVLFDVIEEALQGN